MRGDLSAPVIFAKELPRSTTVLTQNTFHVFFNYCIPRTPFPDRSTKYA